MARLLIVDNDTRIVELTSWFLDRAGHEVATAASYAEARGLLGAGLPDLMLADLDLGSESGREELPRLAAEGLLPPTLVVSGLLDPELERELLALPGVLGTLAKPVDLEVLQRHVQALVDALAAELAAASAPAPAAPVEDDDGWVEIVPLDPGLAAGDPEEEGLS
jgi:DNA-binding response OmpR family regulator